MPQTVIVLNFGGQYNQLIARRVREQNVYCELLPYTTPLEEIKKKKPIGIIFTGGPATVTDADSPRVDKALFEAGIPILGICYGVQLMADMLGGKVMAGPREYGKQILIPSAGALTGGVMQSVVWMSHTYYIEKIPVGFTVTGKTETCPAAIIENAQKKLYGVQFHPEVVHTPEGNKILKNFLYDICGAKGDWKMSNFAQSTIENLKQRLKGKRVLCALSGGVDSAVAATLVHAACPDLICVFVDHGLLRKGEADEVVRVFKEERGMNLIKADASERFLSRLKGVTDPDKKRKIIGEEFIRVFEAEAKKIGAVDCLVQGTIYADVVESGVGGSAKIKAHHNVGGLPDVIDFKEIVEPLRELFKDEVRACGTEIGLPDSIVMRQPFPGPGLGIRIIGEITAEKLNILRESDFILRDEIRLAGLEKDVWQYFTVLLDSRSVGVTGDERSYGYTCAVRAVTGIDGMTADWARIPFDVLEKISTRITNSVREIGRVVYDITSKPPATIEWE